MAEEKDANATGTRETGNGARSDDLTKICGVGPEQVDRLLAAGIRGYPDIARRSARVLAEISGLPPDRVASWPDEARELAAATTSGMPDPPVAAEAPGHHYESFVWRLLLDEEGTIRHTSVQHVQTGEVKRWAWWNREALLDFVESRAVAGGQRATDGQVGTAERTATPAGPPPPDATPPTARPEPAAARPQAAAARPQAAAAPPQAAAAPPQAAARPATRHRVVAPPARSFGMATGSLGIDRAAVLPQRPLIVTLTLDLTAIHPRADRFGYDATVVARRFCDDARTLVARASGMLDAVRPTILLTGDGLATGLYRLEAAVTLRAADGPQRAMAMVDGVVLEVPPAR